MPELIDYLIIGGGLAGGYAANAIRKLDRSGSVLIVTKENHIPYDRVPLSKNYLVDTVQKDRLFFKKEQAYSSDHIEILQGREAKQLEPKSRLVGLDDGRELSYKKLLLATGGYARKLPIVGAQLSGVYYLRTLEDCEQLKSAINSAKKATVIGGGFIGCELATAFASKGLDTTIVEMGAYLLNMALDEETGSWLGAFFEQKGVHVLVNGTASSFLEEKGHVSGVVLKDGRQVPADFVVVAVGIALNTELAEHAGLKVDRGIVVNEFLETSFAGVYAAGDVARFYSPIFQRHLRLEHYDVAVKHGNIAGANMAGPLKKAFNELPYFFSYQFELKINAYGDLSQKNKIVRFGELNKETGFLQFYFSQQGTLDAVLSVNGKWEEVKQARELVSSRRVFPDPHTLAQEFKPVVS